jgi:hypothetical protein
MLTIRDEQWAAFEADARDKRVDQLAGEMAIAWPAQCKALGAAAKVRAQVAKAVERAVAHGFTAPAHQARWVHLTFMLGADLETSPKTAWVPVTLGWDATPDAKLAALERSAQDLLIQRELAR